MSLVTACVSSHKQKTCAMSCHATCLSLYSLYLMEAGVGVAKIDRVVTDRQMQSSRLEIRCTCVEECFTHWCSQGVTVMVALHLVQQMAGIQHLISFISWRLHTVYIYIYIYICIYIYHVAAYGPLARYVKLRVAHAPGIPEKLSRHSRRMSNTQINVSGKKPTSLFQGLFSEISAPTLTFLRDRIDASFEEISRALVARSVGFLLGSLSGGALSQRWNRFINLWLSIAMVVGAVATGFQPWSNGLAVLAFLFFVDGLAKGIIATCKAATHTHTMAVIIGTTILMLPL